MLNGNSMQGLATGRATSVEVRKAAHCNESPTVEMAGHTNAKRGKNPYSLAFLRSKSVLRSKPNKPAKHRFFICRRHCIKRWPLKNRLLAPLRSEEFYQVLTHDQRSSVSTSYGTTQAQNGTLRHPVAGHPDSPNLID